MSRRKYIERPWPAKGSGRLPNVRDVAATLPPEGPPTTLLEEIEQRNHMAELVAEIMAEKLRAPAAPFSKTEQRIQAIEAEARVLGLDPRRLPDGYKAQLRRVCVDLHCGEPLRMTGPIFDKAWKEAGPRLRMAGHATYAGRKR